MPIVCPSTREYKRQEGRGSHNHPMIVKSMAVTTTELQNLLLRAWEDYLYHISMSDALEYRKALLKRFDGDCLPNLYKWPKEYRMILFNTDYPPQYKTSRKLFLFLLGNGCTPVLAGKWILSYYALLTWDKRDNMAKRKISMVVHLYGEVMKVGAEHRYWDIAIAKERIFRQSRSSYVYLSQNTGRYWNTT